jgi:hypothetical protein
MPQLLDLSLDGLSSIANLPGSTIPATNALHACLALKLSSIERKSHVPLQTHQ